MWVGTFHGFGLDLVRRYSREARAAVGPDAVRPQRCDSGAGSKSFLPCRSVHYRKLWDPVVCCCARFYKRDLPRQGRSRNARRILPASSAGKPWRRTPTRWDEKGLRISPLRNVVEIVVGLRTGTSLNGAKRSPLRSGFRRISIMLPALAHRAGLEGCAQRGAFFYATDICSSMNIRTSTAPVSA